MFCSTCGYENTQGVNFCKQCGSNLNSVPEKSASPWMVLIFLAAIALITVIGFVGPMVMFSDLSRQGVNQDPLIAMALFVLMATTVIDWLLIRLLTRLLGFSKQKPQAVHPTIAAHPKYVTAEQHYQPLPEPQISIPSVTEHTTRNFEPIISRESRNRETT